ncbi:hypothetical protein WHR41_05778 [Cladosporium halotolerans]|uniref:Mid2 domain-containing protein n=1 Tax=Cladosporium halotolerans TaxID=1052096 RepID=A0AB34KPW6_9PEZI
MTGIRSPRRLATAILLSSALVHAQESTPEPTPTQTASTSVAQSSSVSGSASSTTTDVPLHLWGVANSLLSEYYPSTTISDVASLTWPDTVVIDSSTYVQSATASPATMETTASSSLDVSRPVTTDDANSNDAQPSDTPSESSGRPKDRTLGIALGVAFGVLAFGLVVLALFCMHRRKKRQNGTGIFPGRRRTGSPTDSEIGEWRSRHPHMGLVTTAVGPMSETHNRPPREWVERYNRLSNQYTPPVHMHPAFVNHQHTPSGGASSETNPFFAPMNSSTDHADRYGENTDYHPGYPRREHNTPPPVPYTPYSPPTRRSRSSRRQSSSSDGFSRPPTPFSPMMMMQASSPPARQNPFTSVEDAQSSEDAAQRQRLTHGHDERDDVVSPIISPTRSPARRSNPLVHYPSWSEVSEFDFSGESSSAAERSARMMKNSRSSDGFGRDRESVVGRSELP